MRVLSCFLAVSPTCLPLVCADSPSPVPISLHYAHTAPATPTPREQPLTAASPGRTHRDHGRFTEQRPGEENVQAQSQWLPQRLAHGWLDKRLPQRPRRQVVAVVQQRRRAPEEAKEVLYRRRHKHCAEVCLARPHASPAAALTRAGYRYGTSSSPPSSGVPRR